MPPKLTAEIDCELPKERAWNNLNNYNKGCLFLIQRSQEEHSCLRND